MSTDATHIIACYRLELDFQDADSASEVSDALMAASRQYAAPLIEACCARLIPSDAYVSISTLEIDLGELNPSNLETDFLEKFEVALSARLQYAFEERAAETPVQRALDLVQNYGETGQYPWWAGSPAPTLLHDAIATLLNAPAAVAHRPFRDLLSRGQILQRLVFALPPAQLTAIWKALSAILPPVSAQATIHAATEAMLLQAGHVERQRWQDFAYQALLRTIPHQSKTADPSAFLSWYAAEGSLPLPEQVIQRFSQRDAFVTTIIWLWESVGVDARALGSCLEALPASGSASNELNIADGMTALRSWMQANWRLSSEVVGHLARGIETTYRLGQASVAGGDLSEEDVRLAWLRRVMEMPEAPYSALVTLLGIRFHQESSTPQSTMDDIEAWLARQYRLPVDVNRGIARDVANNHQGPLRHPEHLSHLEHSRHSHPERSEELQSISRRPLKKDIAEQSGKQQNLPPEQSEGTYPKLSVQNPQNAAALAAQIPWLRQKLGLPSAALPELLVALHQTFVSENPNTEPDATAIEAWLRATYPLAAETRQLLAEAACQAKPFGYPMDSSHPEHSGHSHPERSDGSSKQHNLLPEQSEGTYPKLSVRNPQNAAALAAQIPWLRQKLGLPTAALPELLAALHQRFASENPNTEPEAIAIEAWLRATYPLAPETRQLLAEAAWQARPIGHPLDASHPEHSGHSHPERSDGSSKQHNLPPEQSEGPYPKLSVRNPQNAAALAAQIPWLRQKLSLPTAALPELLAALHQRFASENPNTEPEAIAIEAWLRATYPLAPETRKLLAEATCQAEPLSHSEDASNPEQGNDANPQNHSEQRDDQQRNSQGFLNKGVDQQLRSTRESLSKQNNDEQSSKQHNLQRQQSEGPYPGLSALDAKKAAAMAAQIPWLRQKLGLPTAALPELLAALRQRFASENPNTETEATAIEAWLRATYPLASETRILLAEAAVAKALGREAHNSMESILQKQEMESPAMQSEAHNSVESILKQQEMESPAMQSEAHNSVESILQKREMESPAMQSNEPPPTILPEKQFPAISKPVTVRRLNQVPDAPIFVDNAGLILFWPFLQKYFEYQGLTEGKQFVSALAQMQAVRLLQNMVMPEVEWNEAALALPKLLCGLPPDAVVDPMVPITEEMEATAGILIEVVSTHWTMLGNISEDGFRHAWLWRNGTLRIRDDHWLLRVETMAHDLLMEGLPWELGYILLPWMPHELYVDWGEKAKFNA